MLCWVVLLCTPPTPRSRTRTHHPTPAPTHTQHPTQRTQQQNYLTGTLPSFIGSNPSFRRIVLDNNRLRGSIPDSFYSSFLAVLSVRNNRLTGPLPPSVGSSAAGILQLLLDGNRLTGGLPDSYAILDQATVIDFTDNDLDVGRGLPPWLVESACVFVMCALCFVLCAVLRCAVCAVHCAVLCCAVHCAVLCARFVGNPHPCSRSYTHTPLPPSHNTRRPPPLARSVGKTRANDSDGNTMLCPSVEFRNPFAPALFHVDASYFSWCGAGGGGGGKRRRRPDFCWGCCVRMCCVCVCARVWLVAGGKHARACTQQRAPPPPRRRPRAFSHHG